MSRTASQRLSFHASIQLLVLLVYAIAVTTCARAAIFYSLIESAKLSGVEPAAYVREATGRASVNSPSPASAFLSQDKNNED